MLKSVFVFSIFFCFLFPLNLLAQDSNTKDIQIGIAITPLSVRNLGPLESVEGGGSLSSKKYFSAELTLLYPLKGIWGLQTGFNFSRQQVAIEGAVVNPDVDRYRDTSLLKQFEIPILGTAQFGKLFYANFGPLLHFDFSGNQSVMDKQNGIGLQLGIGANWNMSRNFSLQLEPVAKLYSLLPFQKENVQDRILMGGIKVGVRYSLR